MQDDGGTANGGVDLDQSPNTITINVTRGERRAGRHRQDASRRNEDTPYTFAAADFGFTDPNDAPANSLAAVKITTLPAARHADAQRRRGDGGQSSSSPTSPRAS